MWSRKVQWSPYNYEVCSKSFVIQMTGGSITIKDRATMEVLRCYRGHKYLYTGDIHPKETVCAALEYGKHFYVYSLKDFELVKRVTLPRGFETVDEDGRYSEDGSFLLVRAHRWVPTSGFEGHNEYVMLCYRTDDYKLLERMSLGDPSEFRWEDFKFEK